jgi:hypothetical protein
VAERVDRLRAAVDASGRAQHTVRRYLSLDSVEYSLSSASCFADTVGRANELGFTDVVAHWPRADGVYAGREDVLEEIAADVLPTLPGHTSVP